MKRFIIVIVILSLVFSLGGCAKLTEKASEKLVEGMLEKAAESNGGGDVDVDLSDGNLTVETEDGESMVMNYSGDADWPEDIPETIPELKIKITGTVNIGGGWMITCDEATQKDYDNYLDDLYAAGFEKVFESSSEGTSSISGTIEDFSVMLTYSEGESLSLTVSKQ